MSDFSEENTTTDILDATQNAVIDAVNSVTEILEKTTSESTVAETLKTEPFYQGADVFCSCCGFSGLPCIQNAQKDIKQISRECCQRP